MTHQAGTPAGEPGIGSIPQSYDPQVTPDEPITSADDYALSDATTDASAYSAGQRYGTGQQFSAGADLSTGDDAASGSTADVAKDQAAQVKDTAVEAGKDVAATTKQEAANVIGEAQDQAKSMIHTVTSEVKEQAGTQQQRIAGALHSLAKELGSMASSTSESGPLTDLAQQASHKGGEIAHWLENREPSDVLEEVKRFARKRPVTFLLLCGAAGVLAGRLTRSAVASNTSLDSKEPAQPARALEAQPTATPAPMVPTAASSPTYATSDPGIRDPYAAPASMTEPDTGTGVR